MNEQAIIDSYNTFVSNGYTKSIEEFKKLIASNPQALQDSYKTFQDVGYAKSIDDYKTLMGVSQTPAVEKKNPVVSSATPQEAQPEEQGTMDLSSDVTSSDLSSQQINLPTPQDLPQGQGKPFQLDLSNIKPKETALSKGNYANVKDYTESVSMKRDNPDEYLEAAYGGAGFQFKREKAFGGLSDNLIVTNPDGKKITVAINNFSEKKNKSELEKLQSFIQNSPKAEGVRKDIQEGARPATKKSIDVITPELISGTEEKAVPLMNYHFADLGFKFEESGATGDWMTVTAPDGTSTEIALDNWTSAKDTSEANRLKNFILKKSKPEDVVAFEAKSVGENAKIQSDKEAKETLRKLNEEFNSMAKERDIILGENKNADMLLQSLNSTPEDQRDASWQEKYNSALSQKEWASNSATQLETKRASASEREAQIQSSLGKYYAMKSEQGTWYGNKWNQALEAFGKQTAGISDLVLTGTIALLDTPPKSTDKILFTKDFQDNFIKTAKEEGVIVPEFKTEDELKSWYNSIALGEDRKKEIYYKMSDKQLKKIKYGEEGEEGMMSAIRDGLKVAVGDPNSTVEYSDLSKKGFWGGAIAGLIDFAPAMIGSPIQKTASMFAISNDNMMQEFSQNPEFKDISEGDKFLYALPFNLANSVLLEFGLNRAMANKSIVANLVASSLKRAGANATAAEIKNIMKGEVSNMIGRGALTVTKGAVSGAELGVAMYTTDVAIRQAINEMKGNKMFETPKSAEEFIRGAAQSAASLAAGAGIMSSFHAIGNLGKETGYKGMSNDMFSLFEIAANNSNAQDAFVTDLKNKVSAGELDMAQAKEVLNNYRKSVGLFRELPEGLDIQAKKEAMDLLKEKRDLENKIKDKDPALVKPQQDRINKINEQLTKLSEYAIQKQAADEALLREGREKLGLQQVGEGDAELNLTPEQKQAIIDEKDAFQEILDNPDEHDETDVQEAEDYFADPVKYYEEKIKFYEEEANPTEDDKAALEHFKSMLEAHKALKPKGTTIQAGSSTTVSQTSSDVENNNTFTFQSMDDVSDGSGLVRKGETFNNPEKVTSQLSVGDKIEFTSGGKKRTGVWDGKFIREDGTNNPWGVLGVLVEKGSYIKNLTKIESENKTSTTEVTGTTPAKSTTITVGAGGATATTSGGATEVTTGGEGTETATGGVDNLKPIVVSEKTLDENPVYKITVNGQDRFIQSIPTLNESRASWYEVENKNGKWEVKNTDDSKLKLGLSDTRKEIIDHIAFTSKKEAQKNETKIETQKNETDKEKEIREFFKKKGLSSESIDNIVEAYSKGENQYLIERVDKEMSQSRGDVTMAEGTETKTGNVEATIKALDDARENIPIVIKKISENKFQDVGGTLEAKRAAVKADKKSSITSPSKLPFLPDIINLLHLARNKSDKNNILKNGFDLKEVDMDSPVPGAYFSSEDWSSMDRFGREKSNSIFSQLKNEGLLYFDNLQDFRKYLKENNLPSDGRTLSEKQINYLKEKGVKGILLRNDFASASRNELIVIDNSIIEKTSDSNLGELTKLPSSFYDSKSIAELYHEILKIPETERNSEQNELINTVNETVKKSSSTTVTIKAPEPVGGPEWKPTNVTMAEGRETKTGVMDDIELLIPKYKEYVDRDLNKAKDKLKVAKINKDAAKIEEAKKTLDKAKAAAEEYKTEVAEAKKKAMEMLEESDMYKEADPIQQNELAREVAKRFGERQPSAPSAERITGQPKPEPVGMTGKDVLKEQVKAFARGAKAGVQGVRETITQIVDYVNKTNINTADLKKVMDVLKSKIETESDLNKAIEKVFDIVDKSNADIVEVSKTKIDKDKMKSELDGLRKGKKSVVDKIKAIREYFDSVKEFGNLTRKDLSKVIKEISNVKDEKTLDTAVDNINKIIDNAKTDILEISELKMIKEKMKGIKDAKKNLNEKRKLIAAAIDFIQKSGTVSAKKVGKMLRDIGKVNLEDDTKIEKIIEYAEKVFEDAQYDEKLTKANALKKAIAKLANDASKNAQLRVLGKNFTKIRTSMVDSIDSYIEMASKIKESLKGSKPGDENNPINVAEMVNIENATEYIRDGLESQRFKIQEDMAQEILEKLGVDTTGMSLDEMTELLKSEKEKQGKDKNYKETIIKDSAKKMFEMYSTIIKHMFATGKDPFTGEDANLDATKENVVSKFMAMDLSKMSAKEALEAMDSLSNFLENGSTAKMEDVFRDYEGKLDAERALNIGLKASPLKFYGIPKLGQLLAEQIATLPMLEEMLFKGQSKAALFNKLSGLRELMNASTLVKTMSRDINSNYIRDFYKLKPNGKAFTDRNNIVERGMIAALKRTIVGTPEQQANEFNRVKGLIEKSIDELSVGSEKEQNIGKIYEEVYSKVLKDSKDISDVVSKSDATNVKAVDFWVNEWSKIYDQLADVSENVYNKVLDKEINYTPYKMSALFNRGEAEDLLQANQSAFHQNSGTVYKKMTGVLQDIDRSPELPKNQKTQQTSRYLDLSFDKNNSNALYDALMDVNTAGVIRQIDSFFNSDSFRKIVPKIEDRAILFNSIGNDGRVQDFIRSVRNKDIVQNTQAASAIRKWNVLATIGTSTALGRVANVVLQTAPVAVNTLINTKGKLDLGYIAGPKAEFLRNVGYGISVRGMESQAQIQSINKLVDLAAQSTAAKAIELIDKAGQMYLNILLKNPDVYIAKASWMAYYEKALEKQNIDPKTVDYKTHKVNTEAADYAQRMVDRQQNISDQDLSGKLFTSKDASKRFMSNVVMPFASFRLNQFMRATNDLGVIMRAKDASISYEDKKAAVSSLTGYVAEMSAFKIMSTYIAIVIGSATNYLMGREESEEDYEKRKANIVRGQLTGTVTDVISPLPPADILYANGAQKALEFIQNMSNIEDEDRFKLMTNYKKDDFTKSLGSAGIGIKKVQNLVESYELWMTGKFTDEYGRTKYISEGDRDALGFLTQLELLAALGLVPAEVNSISRNAISFAKKGSSTKEGGKEESEANSETKKYVKTSEDKYKDDEDLDILNKMLENEQDPLKIKAIKKKMAEIKEPIYKSDEQKAIDKQEKAKKEERNRRLLDGYKSKSDMKRYNPQLYKQIFGNQSEDYEENEMESEVDKEFNKKKQKLEDEKQGYLIKKKKYKSGRKKNSDGTYKSSYKSRYSKSY